MQGGYVRLVRLSHLHYVIFVVNCQLFLYVPKGPWGYIWWCALHKVISVSLLQSFPLYLVSLLQAFPLYLSLCCRPFQPAGSPCGPGGGSCPAGGSYSPTPLLSPFTPPHHTTIDTTTYITSGDGDSPHNTTTAGGCCSPPPHHHHSYHHSRAPTNAKPNTITNTQTINP